MVPASLGGWFVLSQDDPPLTAGVRRRDVCVFFPFAPGALSGDSQVGALPERQVRVATGLVANVRVAKRDHATQLRTVARQAMHGIETRY